MDMLMVVVVVTWMTMTPLMLVEVLVMKVMMDENAMQDAPLSD